MPGSYPYYHSLTEKMAAKVVSRVVQDGIGLDDAIKETINYAELNRQQIIHLCSIIQDYGMVYNGDPKNYFYTPGDMGKKFPNTDNGYVVYANKKEKDNMDGVFAAVEDLQEQGFSDEDIANINPELQAITDIINEFEGKYMDVVEQNTQDNTVEFPQDQEYDVAASDATSKIVTAQEEEIQVEEPTPDNVGDVLDDPAPEEEFVDEEPTAGGDVVEFEDDIADEGMEADGGSVTLTQGPDYFEDKITKAPQWDVNNRLSIEQARNYYDEIKKELEEVVFNTSIQIGADLLSKFDAVRGSIDEQIDKIKDADKETEKLEDKEDDLQEEFGVEEGEALEGEAPTEEFVDETPTGEDFAEEAPAAPEEFVDEAPLAPAPKPKPKQKQLV